MKTYLAFISYKHEDIKYAKWLQQKLESFRLPLYLQEQRPDLPDYPRPIFRDETDLELGLLSENIHRALDHSRYLIVICSPRVVKSQYVQDEIRYFKKKYDHKRIIPFIIDGIPFSKNPDNECFPDEIKKIPELLAANINELGQDYAAIKIIARMLDLQVDELWQRYRIAEEAEKQRLKEERDKLLKIQSYYLSEKSLTLYHMGKYDLARKLALQALPQDEKFEERPYIPEADNALRLSYASFKYIFNGHNGCVSPDGRLIAVINNSYNSIVLYCTDSGSIVREFSGVGYFLSISFSCDSKCIACGTRNGTIYIWNLDSGARVGKLEIGFAVVSIAFNPDMKHLMASLQKYSYQKTKIAFLNNQSNSIITVSLESYEIEREWKLGEYEEAPRIKFSHTGKYLASFTHDRACIGTVDTGEIFETEQNVRYISFSEDDRYYVYGFGHCIPFVDTVDDNHTRIYRHYDVSFAAFCGNTNLIMAVCSDCSVRIWKRLMRDERIDLVSILKGHTRPIKWVTANRKGNLVASCSEDNTIKVWSVKDSQCIASTHCESPEHIYFHADERLLVIVTSQNIRLWEFIKDRSLLKLDGYHEGIVSLNYSYDNFSLLTGSSGAELLLWNLKDGNFKKIGKFEENPHSFISAVLSKDCKYIALLFQKAFILWNIEDQRYMCRYKLEERFIPGTILLDEKNDGFIITAGNQILYSDISGNIHEIILINQIFNKDDYEWEEVSRINIDLMLNEDDYEWGIFSCTAIDSKSNLLACGIELAQVGDSYPICLFDRSGKIHRIMRGHTQTVTFIAIDTENPVLISATENGEVKWWNTENGVCEKTISINGKMLSLGFYNGEPRFVYENDGNIVLDDCITRHILCNSSDVNTITLSPDGSLIFIGCGFPSILCNEEGLPIDKRTDCYVQVIAYKSLYQMIKYVKEQCKNLKFTDDEKRIYHL